MNLANIYLQKEIKQINNTLEKVVSRLSPSVKPIARHVIFAGGKRLRPVLCILFARLLGSRDSDIHFPACAMELLHAASLLHDDVLDAADLRRGRYSAHLVYGSREAILTGDGLLALANELVANCGDPRIVACLSEAALHTVSGEMEEMDRLWDFSLTVDEYLEIIAGKTASLIAASCKVGVLLADNEVGVEKVMFEVAAGFGLNLGIAFQLVDDAIDFTTLEASSGKPRGGDLREGKITLPLIYYLRCLAENGKDEEALAILDLYREDDLARERLRETIVLQGHVDATLNRASEYIRTALGHLDRFSESLEKEILVGLSHDILHRGGQV